MSKLLEFIYGKAITEIAKFISDNNLEYIYISFAITMLAISGFIFLISWIYSNRKVKSEIAKLDIEHKEKCMDLLDKVDIYRNDYLLKSKSLQVSTRLLIGSLSEFSQEDDYWNDTAEVFYNDFVNGFNNYLERKKYILDIEKAEAHEFIRNEIYKFLETLIVIYDAMNSPEVTSYYTSGELIISLEMLNPMYRFAERYIKWYHFRMRYSLRVMKKKMKRVASV